MKHIALVLLLLCLFVSCGFDDECVCGTVIEYPFDIPLQAVKVSLNVYNDPDKYFGISYVTYTGLDGTYYFEVPGLGNKYYDVTHERYGYHYYDGGFAGSYDTWGCATIVMEID
ncbi:MAG: hypothetical protein JW881_20955 [Spirochaetales bacterium]|nr:hypothetical protein [Spirochaetales bacterium]